MIKLENWSLCFRGCGYSAPEIQKISLQGNAYGHPKFINGKFVITSYVIDLDIVNGMAKTISGSQYKLGQANPDWLSWLKENNYTKYLDDLEKMSSTLLN